LGHIYYGWFVVAAAMLVYMLSIGTTGAAFGLYIVPVSEELGLSRADMNTGLILLNLGNAAMAPFVGRLLDRMPIRTIMIGGVLLIGASLVVLGLSNSTLLSSAVLAVPMSAGLLSAGTITMTVLMARWFTVFRGRAMTLSVIGMSFGAIIVAPAVGWVIENNGWRTALFVSAAVVTIALLTLAMVLRMTPGDNDIESKSKPMTQAQSAAAAGGGTPPPALALLRMPQFWTIAVGIGLGLAVPQAVVISIVPMGVENGLSMMQASSLIMVTGVAGIAAKLLLSTVADRIDRILLLTVLISLGALPNAALLFSETYALLLICAAVLGLVSGALIPIYYALLADRFGLLAFGTVRGLVVPVTAMMGALGVRFIGEIYDRTGGYDAGFAIFIAVDLAAAALLFATRYTRQVEG